MVFWLPARLELQSINLLPKQPLCLPWYPCTKSIVRPRPAPGPASKHASTPRSSASVGLPSRLSKPRADPVACTGTTSFHHPTQQPSNPAVYTITACYMVPIDHFANPHTTNHQTLPLSLYLYYTHTHTHTHYTLRLVLPTITILAYDLNLAWVLTLPLIFICPGSSSCQIIIRPLDHLRYSIHSTSSAFYPPLALSTRARYVYTRTYAV
ncbi:hypothetical protein F4860DRAFT_84635 [Xylaria cubensis]|nr:hypothetical protein F4860DRAFT_84635 [Xylaria cubensis]